VTEHHLPAYEIQRFLVGALAPSRLPAFEAHLAVCEACAESLASEARAELAIGEALRIARCGRRADVVVCEDEARARRALPRPQMSPRRSLSLLAAVGALFLLGLVLWPGASPRASDALSSAEVHGTPVVDAPGERIEAPPELLASFDGGRFEQR
jgi:hypothetical protein